jgi:HlyD family secretion protein
MFKDKTKFGWMVGIGLLALLIGFGLLRGNQVNAQTETSGDTVTVFVGDLSDSATATGELVAQQEAALTLQQSGEVAELMVSVADLVEAGQPLLRLDTADLERAVANAEQALLIQQANLANLTAAADATDIAAAETAVFSAQATLDDLLDDPSESDIARSEAKVRAAEADLSAAYARLSDERETADDDAILAAELALEAAQREATQAAEQHSTILVTEPEGPMTQERIDEMEEQLRVAAVQANAELAAAQDALDDLLNGDSNTIAARQASVSVAAANLASVQAQHDLLLAGATEVEIAQAEASLANAQANLANLLDGATDAQVAMAEIRVAQAEVSLAQAQLNLERATLTAPFDGMITAVSISEGERASGTLIEMVNQQTMEVVLEVDEVDIGQIEAGQTAVVMLETWPDSEIEATVTAIAARNSNRVGNALVTYEVFLAIEDTDLPMLVGMTANADLIIDTQSEVLLVENRAITADRETGQYFVTQLNGDATEIVEVTIGLRDGNLTQITSGLQAGDELLIQNSIPTQEITPPRPGGGPGQNPFGG